MTTNMFLGSLSLSLLALPTLLPAPQQGCNDPKPAGTGGLVGTWPFPQAPAGNAQDPLKARLGKLLFWDEQLSFDGTMACGTCHIPAAGGSDPRTTQHPPNTPDEDAFGSPGVIRQDANGHYVVDATFVLSRRITTRIAPSPFGAAFFLKLFWDVTADEVFPFLDVNGLGRILTDSAALESLSVRPPISPVEMGHDGMTWNEIEAFLPAKKPMALASNLQGDFVVLPTDTYASLFQAAFGSPGVTRGRVAMALAQYMRTLVPNQAPIDLGMSNLTADARAGFDLFNDATEASCASCHSNSATGVIALDTSGEFFDSYDDYLFSAGTTADVLGDVDLCFAKISTFRNVALFPRVESRGRFAGLADILANHYLQDGDPAFTFGFDHQADFGILMEFFRALIDPRVANELAPFDRPTLYSEVVPFESNIVGQGSTSPGNDIPLILAATPPLIGAEFKFGVGLAPEGKLAVLYSSDATVPPPGGSGIQWEIDTTSPAFRQEGAITLNGQTEIPGVGVGTLYVTIDDPALAGTTRYYQWIVRDSNAPGGFRTTRVGRHTFFL